MPLYLNEDGSGYYWLEDDSGFLEAEDGNPPINVPFIDSETVLFTPSLDDTSLARISQVPVEAIILGDPKARVSQVPAEMIRRRSRETVTVIIID